MLKKFDMFNQDYSKVAIALIFIILIVILVFNNKSSKNQVTCPEPSKVIKDHINYKYDINIDFNNEKSKVSVVKYDNKYLITYDETKYYMYYSDFYKEEQGMYVKFNDMIRVLEKETVFPFLFSLNRSTNGSKTFKQNRDN